MHQSLPFKAWQTSTGTINFRRSSLSNDPTSSSSNDKMKKIVDENALIVFGRRGCCMSHVVRRLLLGLGVNPAVYEVDEEDEPSVIAELEKMGLDSGGMSFPTVFIGGRWFGGLDRVMATHITGELTPILRQAGALWL